MNGYDKREEREKNGQSENRIPEDKEYGTGGADLDSEMLSEVSRERALFPHGVRPSREEWVGRGAIPNEVQRESNHRIEE